MCSISLQSFCAAKSSTSKTSTARLRRHRSHVPSAASATRCGSVTSMATLSNPFNLNLKRAQIKCNELRDSSSCMMALISFKALPSYLL